MSKYQAFLLEEITSFFVVMSLLESVNKQNCDTRRYLHHGLRGLFFGEVVKQAVREAATICPRPCKLTFDLLTLKVVFESRVTWATSVPILVFLGLPVLDLGPMYVTDVRQTDVRRASSLNASALWGGA